MQHESSRIGQQVIVVRSFMVLGNCCVLRWVLVDFFSSAVLRASFRALSTKMCVGEKSVKKEGKQMNVTEIISCISTPFLPFCSENVVFCFCESSLAGRSDASALSSTANSKASAVCEQCASLTGWGQPGVLGVLLHSNYESVHSNSIVLCKANLHNTLSH